MHTLKVTLCFRLHSAVHVTGEHAQLWTDKVLVRDWHDAQHPVVPATTLKGWLREAAERALRSLGAAVCDGSSAGTICGGCPVCQVFGAPRRRSPLRFADAVLRDATTDVKMHVSLSRYRRTAYEERLFSLETAWQQTFTAQIRGLFPDIAHAEQAAMLLWLGARMGYAIGAGRSRGLGWVHMEKFRACVDGQELVPEKLAQALRGLAQQTAEVSS